MFREKTVPPASGDSLAGVIRIQAERAFSLDSDDLAIDYTGEVSPETSNRLLLAALMRKKLERVLETARSAGLVVLSATVSSVALSQEILGQMLRPWPGYFLYVRPDFAEFLAIEDRHVIDVKHIQRIKKTGTRSLISEVRRVLSLYEKGPAENRKEDLILWGLSALSEQESADIKSSLSSQVNIIDCDDLETVKLGLTGKEDAHDFLPPAALGRALIDGGDFYMDFVNSRMHAKVSRIKRTHLKWASAIVSAVIIIVLGIFISWKMDKMDVAELKSKLEGMSEEIITAQNIVEKVGVAHSWYSGRPEILNCILELTMDFPEEGRVWATNLALNEDMEGIVSGKATDEESVMEVLDKLKKNILFSDVQMIYMRDSGRTSQDISFSINFSYGQGE
jgi:hypothetical protein